MVIEWLKFTVNPQLREKFVKLDREIWTATLAQFSGFLGKEVWISPIHSDEVVFVIHWQSRDAWKAVPAEVLADTEAKFAQAMGQETYTMTESEEYMVRQFPNK